MRQDDHGRTGADRPDPPDLVFDFSGVAHLDFAGLSLLLTARQIACEDRRDVWLRGFPGSAWRVLHALGLQDYFRLFPLSIGPTE